jgi:hypothetical protein
MTSSPTPESPVPIAPAAPDGSKPAPAARHRAPRTPLTPARVGDAIGEGPDPEQDVAPNLGGEQQMQDA